MSNGRIIDRVRRRVLAMLCGPERSGSRETPSPFVGRIEAPPFGIPVRRHHLGERSTIKHRAEAVTVAISNVIQLEAAPGMDTEAQLPVLPMQLGASNLEAHAGGLFNRQRLQRWPAVAGSEEIFAT